MPAINGYNNTFTAFVNFAQERVNAGEKKAIANIATTNLGKRRIVASTTDGVGLSGMFRTRWEEGANNATRDIFLKAVARMFGGKSKIPESVWDALNLQDHPDLVGEKVYLKGDLVSAYYGIPGLKAPSDYQF